MEERFEILKTKRDRDKLNINGFLYTKEKNRGDKFYWKCDHWRSALCSARATTSFKNNSHTLLSYDNFNHTHPPNDKKIETAKVTSKVKKSVVRRNNNNNNHHPQHENNNIHPVEIIQDMTSPSLFQTEIELTEFDVTSRQVNKTREENFLESRSFQNINLSDDFKFTYKGEYFIRDILSGEGHIFLFVTDDSVRRLSEAEFWFCDSSFRILTNDPFCLLTIYAAFGNQDNLRVISFAYALMSSKSELMYRELYKELNELAMGLGIELRPDLILTDFELASMNALRAEFKGSEIKGSNFFLCKSIWRYVENFSLSELHRTDSVFNLMIRHLPALSFLPSADIPQAFDDLKLIMPRGADGLLKFFEDNFIRGRLRKRHYLRSCTAFDPRIWSVYDKWELELPYVIKYINAWHQNWNNLVTQEDTGICSVIGEIKNEQARSEAELENVLRGEDRPKLSSEELAKEQGFRNAMKAIHNTPTKEFLRIIADLLEV